MAAGIGMATLARGALTAPLAERQLCSGCCPWRQMAELTLNGIKRSQNLRVTDWGAATTAHHEHEQVRSTHSCRSRCRTGCHKADFRGCRRRSAAAAAESSLDVSPAGNRPDLGASLTPRSAHVILGTCDVVEIGLGRVRPCKATQHLHPALHPLGRFEHPDGAGYPNRSSEWITAPFARQ